MGYGYAETFLIIFLTHPGVIIPSISSITNKLVPEGGLDMLALVSPKLADFAKKGMPASISALNQVFWAWLLSLPGEKSAAFGWTMYVIYIIFLLIYMYFAIPLRLRFGV